MGEPNHRHLLDPRLDLVERLRQQAQAEIGQQRGREAGADVLAVTREAFGTGEDEDTEEEKTYQIVGDQEADVKAGRISVSSPIARAMIGKEAGDSIEVNAPGGSKGYEILSVSWG